MVASDSSTPVIMYRPEGVSSIDWIQYDKQTLTDTDPMFTLLTPVELTKFLSIMNQQRVSDDGVSSFNLTVNTLDTFKIIYRTDKAPSYYTTFDDGTVLFDSFDSTVDSNLQASKALAYGITEQNFSLTDSFIPNLDDRQFNLLINESIALASVELKQQVHPKAEAELRRDWISLQRTKTGIPVETDFDKLPDYGRK